MYFLDFLGLHCCGVVLLGLGACASPPRPPTVRPDAACLSYVKFLDSTVIFFDLRTQAPGLETQITQRGILEPVESKTRTHNRQVGSARRRADGGAGRR